MTSTDTINTRNNPALEAIAAICAAEKALASIEPRTDEIRQALKALNKAHGHAFAQFKATK